MASDDPRMPANNILYTSASLNTHGIWKRAIRHDPYQSAEETEKPDNQASVSKPRLHSRPLAGLEQKGFWKGEGLKGVFPEALYGHVNEEEFESPTKAVIKAAAELSSTSSSESSDREDTKKIKRRRKEKKEKRSKRKSSKKKKKKKEQKRKKRKRSDSKNASEDVSSYVKKIKKRKRDHED